MISLGRMLTARAAALAMLVVGMAAPAAAEGKRLVGDWIVSAEEDRFGDGGTVIAMTGRAGRLAGMRCMRRKPSIALFESASAADGYRVGEEFTIRFRADRQPVIESEAIAISGEVLQIDAEAEAIIRQVRGAREFAFRVLSGKGVASDWLFKPTRSRDAVAAVVRECRID